MNLYIVELPERLPVQGNVRRVGFAQGSNESEAVRNYLFREGSGLSERGARIVSADIRDNGGYEKRAHLVPGVEMEGNIPRVDRTDAVFYAFAQELAGGRVPDSSQLRRAGRLWRAASRKNQ